MVPIPLIPGIMGIGVGYAPCVVPKCNPGMDVNPPGGLAGRCGYAGGNGTVGAWPGRSVNFKHNRDEIGKDLGPLGCFG